MPKTTVKQPNIKEESTLKKSDTKTTKSKKATESSKKSTTAKKRTTSVTQKTTKVATKKTTTSTKKKSTSSTTKAKSTATSKKAASTKRKKTTVIAKPIDFAEYYDLPYRYNQTIIKVLAQTPQMLFVYWDISDKDRTLLHSLYGEELFAKTKPVLLVHNETMNYTFEVEINDFANSWYLHVNDANCKYTLELGRRPNPHQDTIKEDYIYIASSNQMDSPNDHILFEKFQSSVTYRNMKTGKETKKDFSKLSNLQNMKEIYGIYNLYKEIYKDELFNEIVDGNLSNSSSLSSSQFK